MDLFCNSPDLGSWGYYFRILGKT